MTDKEIAELDKSIEADLNGMFKVEDVPPEMPADIEQETVAKDKIQG